MTHLFDVPEDRLAPSPDVDRVAGWVVAQRRETDDAERTDYLIGVWRLADASLVWHTVLEHVVDYRTGAERGGRVLAVSFTAPDRLRVELQSADAFSAPESLELELPS